jgi:hypothetical protein
VKAAILDGYHLGTFLRALSRVYHVVHHPIASAKQFKALDAP